VTANAQAELRRGRRKRILLENLTAYTFLLPAGIIIFLFGIFPVLFALFVSLHQWRRFPDEFIGLGNYEQALGGFAYLLFFWLALGAIGLGLYMFWRFFRAVWPERKLNGLLYLLPGAINAGALLLFIRWIVLLLPVILNIPVRLRGQEQVQGLFVNELFASFRFPEVADAGNQFLLVFIIAVVTSIVIARRLHKLEIDGLLWRATGAFFVVAAGLFLLQLTISTIATAIETARVDGTELPVWSQIIIISVGVLVLAAAWMLWRRALRDDRDSRFLAMLFAAILLLIAGYVLVAEVPRLFSSADQTMLGSFSVTVMYAGLAVPFQLAIGLGLAYLLFQNLKGKTLFRMIFFMPYIMPFIATSVVFSLLFSHRQDSIINNLIGVVGIPPQKWLLEPKGIFQLIFGPEIPSFLVGPGLALVVIIIYSVWTYAGYATVVFLAGLGNISGELYEAARIDGASGWSIFRYITLPLLSPTTFFLTLIAIIGTFQAFTQLWIMRTPAANRSVDTASIYIFRQLTDSTPNYGYGSAVAFVLFGVILILTIAQNRIAARRVFYG
jgi:ABC-type sugar transport system permease subunit